MRYTLLDSVFPNCSVTFSGEYGCRTGGIVCMGEVVVLRVDESHD